ncbi:hypothetical protein, conserved [Angomonas deanei]|uniref:Uncharacterized protein n=1 Tax=Angomonas deanei TaxID=59799 RepID=A0A7G2C449_9TRYP|nr:hypothetical protein, conserved [Angomonas deanei]
MMAYLYCLVRETQYASQELLKSLDIILPPNSPLAGPGLSLECRLCASVLLRHYISLRPLEYNSPDYVRVQLYIRWLALPFPANSFASTTQYTLAKVINKLNKVEWLEQLAYTTLGIPNTVKKDLLVSAMYKAMNVVRGCLNGEEETTTTTDTTSFHPSVYLGTECASPAIAAQLLARLKRDAVVKRVENLLESASHLESGGREEEITYFRIALHTPDIREMDSETLFLEKLEQNPVVITAVGQLLRGLRTTTYQAVPYPILLYYLFHGCIQQYDAKERRICVEQELRSLLRQASEKESKLSLEYPRGRFLPPLQALVHFRRRVVEAVADSVDFAVELHTNLPVPTTVKNVKLTFTAAKGEGRERGLCQVGGGDVVVALPDTASFDGAHASCVLLSKVVFTHSGAFYCSSWCATVEMEGAAMEITHHYTAEEVKQTESEQRIMTSSVFPIVQVVSPVSYLTVECDEHVTAVEGETATIRVTLRVGEKALQGGICRAPSEPQLYTLDTTDLPPGVLEGGEEEGLISFRLVDVAPQTATSFDLLVKVLRGGRYRLPLFFRYAVEDSGMQVELVKKLTFSVYPPFSVSYAYMGAVPWREEGVQSLQNDLPNLGDTLFTQDEANVLLPVNETAFRLLQRLGEEVKLFFAVKSGSSHPGTLHVTKGTTLTVVATVHCWASGGLTVWRADTVCNPAVRLLFSSTGTFPLFLEEKESATVLAKMQITETGVINPGFLRVLFSPNRANSQRLFADLCYPPITAEPPRLTARVRFPLTASVREPFPYEIDLTNESGEKGLRGRVELFFREKPDQAGLLVEGSTSVTFELRASGKMTVPVRLRGVTHGEYELPLFEVRDVERDEVVTRHTDTHRVRVLE